MFDLSDSEILFYSGLAIMIAAFLAALLCIIIFSFTGSKLKSKLEQDYGKLQNYNIRENKGR